jgi:putative spermidine/putrescine transport system ATP-binding protein
VQLGGLGARRIQELSGGQQQRVAIARALVYQPDLVLLDEPLAALDRKLREEMQLEFRRIQQELGVTTINVTHDQREALVMSDEVLVMDKGRAQQLASPDAAYRAPANAFVAGFIGVTNFLEAVVLEAGRVRIAGRECDCGTGPGAPPAAGAVLDCALRAEHVRITPSGAHVEADVQLAAIVQQVVFEGDRTLYEVGVAELGGAVLRVIDRSPEAHLRLAPGTPVRIGWRARDLIPFPR